MLWLGTANWRGGFCHAPPRPQRGTSPRTTLSHSALGRGSTIRHTKVWRAGVVAWYSELARRILRRPTPTPAGDKPLASRSLRPHYIFSFRLRTWVYNSAHQGLKSRSCGLVRRVGAADSATPHPPQRGTSPRATFFSFGRRIRLLCASTSHLLPRRYSRRRRKNWAHSASEDRTE